MVIRLFFAGILSFLFGYTAAYVTDKLNISNKYRKIALIFIAFIIAILLNSLVYSQESNNPYQVIKKGCNFELSFNSNNENYGYYRVYIGYSSGEFSYWVTFGDTVGVIVVPDSLKNIETYLTVSGIDANGNESILSEEIMVIPKIVKFDLVSDNKNRIDTSDLNKFLQMYRKYFMKSIWR